MIKKHIYIYKNKKTQEVFADLFAKDLLEGVTTFPRMFPSPLEVDRFISKFQKTLRLIRKYFRPLSG